MWDDAVDSLRQTIRLQQDSGYTIVTGRLVRATQPFVSKHSRPQVEFETDYKYFFSEVASTLMDLLVIDLMLPLSHVKQMYSQPLHLSRELINTLYSNQKRKGRF